MAPRRGGSGGSFGGSSGGSSSPVCPGFLAANKETSSPSPIVYYISYCLFFVLTFGILIYTCCVRKRSVKLVRLLIIVLSFMSLAWALVVLGVTLRECWVLENTWDYYNFVIASAVFFNIGQWLLLFIQVWGVNRMLSQRHDLRQAIVKIITLAITGVVAALTAGYTGLYCYNLWQAQSGGGYYTDLSKVDDERKLAAAYWILYLLSVLAGGAISVALLMQIRSKSIAVNDIMKRTIALTLFMLLWVIFQLVPTIEDLQEQYLGVDTNTAMYYLQDFFQVFSYLAVISFCKSNFWKESATQTAYNTTGYGQPAYAPVQPPPQQQYAYNGQPVQQYYYQQQPVYTGVPAPVNGNGHMAEVK